MTAQLWRVAFSIALSLNAAHAIAKAGEGRSTHAAESCSETRGLREVAEDETKTFSELCEKHSGNLGSDCHPFNTCASVAQSADSEPMRSDTSTRIRSRQRDEVRRHPDLKPVTSLGIFSVSQRINR